MPPTSGDWNEEQMDRNTETWKPGKRKAAGFCWASLFLGATCVIKLKGCKGQVPCVVARSRRAVSLGVALVCDLGVLLATCNNQ
jgi:hypothetical protein